MTNYTPRRPAVSAVAALGIAAALSLTACPAAQAARSTVSPGDEIRAVAATLVERCTLGYTYTDPATATAYGITAGHCNKGHSSYVEDRTTGAIGHFVLTAATDDPLDDDYGLIDFGTNTAVPTMYGMPVVGMARINERNAICHDGIRTGIACGQLGDRYIGPQYLTTGMPNSIPGDSGGPVWQISARGTVIVGIWLGEHIDDATATHCGRFIDLADVAEQIAKTYTVV
jgi:streptogrisin B